jgi:hypothetical protein
MNVAFSEGEHSTHCASQKDFTRLKLARGAKDKEHAMSQTLYRSVAVIGIDIGKNSFQRRRAIRLRIGRIGLRSGSALSLDAISRSGLAGQYY